MRASGPGGQNVNKVSSAAQLRFDVLHSHLPEEVKSRLMHLAGRRMTASGELILEAHQYRTQEQNREAAIQRFKELVGKALKKPKPRTQTRPTQASKEKRLESKKRRGEIKQSRRRKFTRE